MNEILPGGIYSDMYNAYLDMIADFAKQVDGAILFRPFHENTGSWFWWGADLCDAEQYKNVYRYTVEYLRDTKNVHNILYVYGPSSDAESTEQYAERYPGDAYVDMVGFDMYDADPVSDEDGYAFMENFAKELSIVNTFAEEHGKLIAVTETGMSSSTPDEGHGQTALHDTGNQQKDWYNKELEVIAQSNACYMLLWANFSKKDGYYTPYVDKVNEDGTLHGHEMLDNFISFYNDPRTIFANDQKSALAAIDGSAIAAESAVDDLYGYFIAPIAGKRLLNETTLSAKISAETDEQISFVLQGKNETIVLPAKLDGKTASAKLDEATLEKLGASIEGTIQLCAGERVLQTISVIFNIAEPVEDPYEVDGFENYYGLDSLLTEKWDGNHAAESSIEVSLNEEKACDGDYAMQFSYQETSDGWAGVTIAKETDWSDRNALSFYTIPDGKNQKTVVQITANNTVYEVYLNQYADYAKDTDGTPLLVTIPFADFCERDTEGNPTGGLVTDASAVTSVGLWVNAIAGSDAIEADGTVAGVIIYDKIVAVSTELQEASFVPQTKEADKKNEDNKKSNEDKTQETETTTGTTSAVQNGNEEETGVVLQGKTTTKGTKVSLTKAVAKKVKAAAGGADVTIVATVKKENGKTAFTLQTDSANLKTGKKLYLYAVENGSYVAVDAKAYSVSEKSVTVSASKNKTYVLLNSAEAKKASKAILKTVQAKKSALTIKKGASKLFELSSKLNTASVKSIAYTTTDKSVATVSKKGKITAKKAGKATVKAKVTLKNGKTKTVTMKVTVK
jgi:mannan endo-1,4-beta-mannosidase